MPVSFSRARMSEGGGGAPAVIILMLRPRKSFFKRKKMVGWLQASDPCDLETSIHPPYPACALGWRGGGGS